MPAARKTAEAPQTPKMKHQTYEEYAKQIAVEQEKKGAKPEAQDDASE